MKVYFYQNKNEGKCGTLMLLQYLLKKNGVEVVQDPLESDCIWISLYDITTIDKLMNSKKFNKPIVVGGDIAKIDSILNLADYAVRGEAYNFIPEFAKLKNIKDIVNIPNVWTKDKQGTVDYEIKYRENPLIKASPKVVYYYGGKGCPQRCKFCFYSWANEYTVIDQPKVVRAINNLKKSERLYLTCAYFPYPNLEDKYLKRLGMIDLKIRQYLKKKYPSRSFRIGIEFFSEAMRKKMGKPISNDLILELINKSLEWNHEIVMYFIVGLEDQEAMLHFQYIDFNQLTPLANLDVRIKKDFDTTLLQKELNKKNRRMRVMNVKYKTYSNYRTIIQRIRNKQEAEFVYKLRNEKDTNLFLNKIEKRFPHLLGTINTI